MLIPSDEWRGCMSIEEFVTTKRAAEILGVSESYLAKLRCVSSNGPRFTKLGKAVRYAVADLRGWAAEHARRSTSDTRAA